MPSFKLENKSARILHINLGGGNIITVPPTEGGITVKLDDAEATQFDKAIALAEVQAWVEANELIITDAEPEPEPPAEPATEDDVEEDDP